MVRMCAALLITSIVLFNAPSVATAPPEQTPQDASALLTEVRLLRQAIENLAGNGARVQIVFGRLQLQEQRTAVAARRFEDARNSLAVHTAKLAEASGRLKEIEGLAADTSQPAERQEAVRASLNHYTREVKQMEAERVRLALLESEASSALADEQSRWADLNRQLEEIERALAPRRQ
jgi:hypothetical protein